MHPANRVALTGLALLACTAPLARGAQLIDVSAGAFVPLDGDVRELFGTGFITHLGYGADLGDTHTAFFVDVGYMRARGNEFADDPTFDFDDSEIVLVPVHIGVRTNVVRSESIDRFRLVLGVAWESAYTRWTDPLGATETAPAFGIVFSFRPEAQIGERFRIWGRQRVSLISDSTFRGRSDLNLSGSILEAGVSFVFP